MTSTINVDDTIANALRILRKEPSLEKGLTRVLRDYISLQIGQYTSKIREFEAEYGSFEKLEDKILQGKHSWKEEQDFFDWESLSSEVPKLRKLLKEVESVED